VQGEFAPTDFAVAPGDEQRAFIVDQPGRVLVLEDGTIREEPFLDIRYQVVDLKLGHDEHGQLGFTFHSDYQGNRRLFVRYSAPPREGTPEGEELT